MNLVLIKHCCLSVTFIVLSFVLASVQILSIVLLTVGMKGLLSGYFLLTIEIHHHVSAILDLALQLLLLDNRRFIPYKLHNLLYVDDISGKKHY